MASSPSACATTLEQHDASLEQRSIPSPVPAAPSFSPSPSPLSANARDSLSPSRQRQRTHSSRPPPSKLTPSVQLALADPTLAKSLSSSPAPSRAGSEADDQTHAKRNFELNVRRYYYQLTVGCQQTNCSNRLCRSCPASPKMSKDAAAILSVQLAARPRLFFCSHCPLDPAIPSTDSPLSGEPGDSAASNMSTLAQTRQRTTSGLAGNTKHTTSARSSPGIKYSADNFGRTRDNRTYEPNERSESTPSFPRFRALSPRRPAPSTSTEAHRTPADTDSEHHSTTAGMPLFRSLLSVSPFSDMFSSSKSTSHGLGSGHSRTVRRSFSNNSIQDTQPRPQNTRNMLTGNGTSKKKPQPRSFSPPATSQRHRMTDMMDRVHTWRSKTTMSTPASLYSEDAVGLGLTSRSLQSRDFLDLSQYYRSASDSQRSISSDQKSIRHKWHGKAVETRPSCATPQFGSTRDPDSDEDAGSAVGNEPHFPPTDWMQWNRSEPDDLQLSPTFQTSPFGPCDSADLPNVSPSRLHSEQERPPPFPRTAPRRRDSVGSVDSADSESVSSSIDQSSRPQTLDSLPGKDTRAYPSSSPLIFNRRSSFSEQGQTDFALPYLNLTLLRQAIVTYNSSTADSALRGVSSSDLLLKPIPTVAGRNTVDSLQRLLGSTEHLNLDSEVSHGIIDSEGSETSAVLESSAFNSSRGVAHEPALAPEQEMSLPEPCISPANSQTNETRDQFEHGIGPGSIEPTEGFENTSSVGEPDQLKSPIQPTHSTAWYSGIGSTEGDSTFLLDSLRSVFASASALGSSFLIKDKESRMLSSSSESPSADNGGVGGIDLEALRECYEMMIELRPRTIFAVQVTSSMEMLLARLELELEQLGDLKVWSEEEMRALIVLLMNPFLFEQPYQESLLRRILLIFTSLPDVSTLCNWLSWLDEEGLAQLVTLFKMYLSAHFTPRPSGATHPAICTVQALDILYRANMIGTKREQERRRRLDSSDPSASTAISYKYFYSGVMEALKFKDEYLIWRKNWGLPESEKQFSYFDYPFLMSPTSKSHIINLDALTQMSVYYEDACVRHALADHAQRLLPEAGTPSAREFQKGIRAGSSPYLVLELTRAHLVEEAFEQITQKHADLKKPLKVAFVDVGEEGMDQGGVTKEFFQIMVEKVFDSQFGLFKELEDGHCWWFEGQLDGSYPLDISVREREMRLVEYELVGILVGLALYNGVILGVRFPSVTYRKLLGWEIDLDSFTESFPALGRGLEQMLSWSDGDVYDVFMRSFEISYEHLSQVMTLPLIPDGENILVTNENRTAYVDAYIQHYVYEHVDQEFQAFQRGFDKICGGEALKLLRPEELELLLCGNTELDMHDLEASCLYDDGYSSNHTLIKEFWELVHNELTPEQHKKLLAFVTGSDRVPIRGLKDLTFVIQRNGPDSDRLPTALTCFSRLLLPEFSGKDKLKERLVTAIENANGFGLV